jgi:membrane protein YdbS with pleckstrin-like domain
MRLERHTQPLASSTVFLYRVLRRLAFALGLVLAALAIGMVGYRVLAPMGWVDAFVNAAMIMSGMGPVTELTNDTAKIFAGLYAIVCGFLLLINASLIMTPVFHRVLHRFHVDEKDRDAN